MFAKPVIIHKGQGFVKTIGKTSQKNIVFDLDETLGSFSDLYKIWIVLFPMIPLASNIDTITVFKELIQIFPEFLRPGIIPILEYLSYKKRVGLCSNVFLYTNNQCPPEWVYLILKYFDEEIPNLFDKIICAFKIGDQRFELLRTTHSKTYNDLIRCTLLPKNSEFCFIDNSYHSKMVNDRVYYIQPRSYEHGLTKQEILNRILTKWVLFPLPESIEFSDIIGSRKITRDSIIVSQKIMYYLKEYFLLSTKVMKTKKFGWKLGKFTRKKR